MNNSEDKIRLRITSPTLDESDDFSSVTRNFIEGNKSDQTNGGTAHPTNSQRISREDSPTER